MQWLPSIEARISRERPAMLIIEGKGDDENYIIEDYCVFSTKMYF